MFTIRIRGWAKEPGGTVTLHRATLVIMGDVGVTTELQLDGKVEAITRGEWQFQPDSAADTWMGL